MKKYTIGLLLGLLIASLVFIPILLHERESRYDLGRRQGKLDGIYFSVDTLAETFGTVKSQDFQNYEVLYAFKTSMVIAIDVDGVKTIRVIE